MDYPKISIVTPSYNQGQFIEDAIRSVLQQDYPNFEHIIIDNCSTDETIDILNKYSHLTWISEPDRGQSDALNKGFKMASGDIVGWLNTDEFYLSGIFQRIAKFFKEKKDIDVVYGDTFWYFLPENKIALRKAFPFSIRMLKYWGQFFHTSSTFFRRRFIDEQIMISEEYEYHMDHEFILRLAKLSYRFRYLNAPLSVFRRHADSKTSTRKNLKTRLRERRQILLQYGFPIIGQTTVNLVIYQFIEWYYTTTRGLWRLWIRKKSTRYVENIHNLLPYAST